MSKKTSASSPQQQKFSIVRFFANLGILMAIFVVAILLLRPFFEAPQKKGFPTAINRPAESSLSGLNALFDKDWQEKGIKTAPDADFYTLARRISLGLTGAVPSLQEIRQLERTSADDRLDAWLDHVFSDQRYSNYLAERFARIYVGVEPGPFLVYRRRRMVNWIADQLTANRRYDEMARELIASKGIWTSSPAANFITVTNQEGNDNGPDEVMLAARTSRAFLGVSLDCVQCHDDKFGDRWKQKDFHQLAAFYSKSEIGITGVFDNPQRDYKMKYRGMREAKPVSMEVPFQAENLPPVEKGSPRDQLAAWITHPENRSFSRAIANRAWAILFGRPLVTPIDDIPIEGAVPPVLDYLADEFVASDHDLQELFRLIANSAPFLRSSRSDDPNEPIFMDQEKCWAAFPLTQLRPEQVSGSIIQAASVKSLDSGSHILHRIIRDMQTNDFVKRYGDKGESEFTEGTGTIPQRLILMNGNLLKERTEPNPFLNSSTRIAALAKDSEIAIGTAFLSVLTRLPTDIEKQHFIEQLGTQKGDYRQRTMQDIYWALMNSTEFSWNR